MSKDETVEIFLLPTLSFNTKNNKNTNYLWIEFMLFRKHDKCVNSKWTEHKSQIQL